MSTIGTNSEDLILNADGSGSDIKFKSNGTEVGSISDAGVMTATSFSGSGANLTGVGVAGISSSADATAITITSAERIGINHTTPEARLEIDGGSETALKVTATVGGEYPAIFQSASTNATPIADFRKSGGTSQLQVLSDGRGLSQFTAKAWVQFTGSGTVSIDGSHNVSSITDQGVGRYRINFTNNLANANYAMVTQSNGSAGGDTSWQDMDRNSYAIYDQQTSSFRMAGYWPHSYYDSSLICAIVFGD